MKKSVDEILAKLRLQSLNAMQQEAVDTILHEREDVVLLSPTGTGKTLAYLLPVIQQIDEATDDVQSMVVVPGRELALQSLQVLTDMGSGVRGFACYGGRPTMDEHQAIKRLRPQIIFSTPGRLNDHLDKGNFDVSAVKWVVIDEFDKCMEMGFQREMEQALTRLPQSARRILLSATDAEMIPRFMQLHAFKRLDYLQDNEQLWSRLRFYRVLSPTKDKLEVLSLLLRGFTDERTVVFLNYRESVERAALYLAERGFSVSAFHGGLDQRSRENALYRFANGSANVLVCTDLASRGIDIPDIENIVHYHLPETEQAYIHRVGRTARWKASGKSFFILGPEEKVPDYIHESFTDYQIADDLPSPAKPKFATLYLGKGKKDKISKGDIVGFLCKIGQLSGDEIGRIDVKPYYAYVAVAFQKVKQVLKLTKGQKIKGIKTILEEVR